MGRKGLHMVVECDGIIAWMGRKDLNLAYAYIIFGWGINIITGNIT
jgi:hypothetical protein